MESMDTLPPFLHSSNSEFAHLTVKERWPVIIAQTVDSLHRHRADFQMEGVDLEKLKLLTGLFGQLRYEVMTDKPITLLSFSVNQGVTDDLEQWNALLKQNGVCLARVEVKVEETKKHPSWYSLPWLLVECYLYRRIADLVASSGLGNLDPFMFKKREGFMSSTVAAQHFLSFMADCQAVNSEHVQKWFSTVVQAALWANEFDLSLHVDESHPVSGLTGDLQCYVKQMSDRLVVDDTHALFSMWTAHLDVDSKVHMTALILDNTGPELLADLCLAEFLISHKLSTRVYFYPKCIPWFVSDVTPRDIASMLDEALRTAPFGTDLHVYWADRFRQRFASGQFTIKLSGFWTLPSSYPELRSVDSALYEELNEMDVVIFKGDLNYRKILADRQWVPDSVEHKIKAFSPLQFERPTSRSTEGHASECGSSIAPGDPLDCRCSSPDCRTSSGPIIVALRVAKSDTAVGLSTSMLRRVVEENKDWWVIGRYGFVQIVSPIKLFQNRLS